MIYLDLYITCDPSIQKDPSPITGADIIHDVLGFDQQTFSCCRSFSRAKVSSVSLQIITNNYK